MILIDSCAWIEFFKGSPRGQKIKSLIESSKCYTSIISISEITGWCLKNNLDNSNYIKTIEENSTIVNLKREIAILAGIINYQNKKSSESWGMIDSLIYSTSKVYNLKLITCDNHFRGLQDTRII